MFDRSHYEDVLIGRVRQLADAAEIERRYDAITAFEERVAASGVRIVKVMLHISPEEQKARLMERLERPDKHWKYNPGDVDERMLWPQYMQAYQTVFDHLDRRGAVVRGAGERQVVRAARGAGAAARGAAGHRPAVARRRLRRGGGEEAAGGELTGAVVVRPERRPGAELHAGLQQFALGIRSRHDPGAGVGGHRDRASGRRELRAPERDGPLPLPSASTQPTGPA